MQNVKEKGRELPREILMAAWAIALGAIAPMLDSTMVNIAIDILTKDFQTTLDIIQWSITGYVLALAMAVPVSGWLMNQFNGKKIFVGAVVAFGIISVFVGFSWNVFSFIFFRLVQGFSAGIITTLMFTLLVKTAGPDYLGRVMAIVSTPMIFGPILGPVIGGFIVQWASWQWIFFINVLIVLISAPLMMRKIPNFEPFNRDSKLDVIGIACLSFMSAALIYGITKAADHASFNNPETLLWVGIGLALAVIYFAYNRFTNNQTVLPLNLFVHRSFLASSVGLFLANMAIMGPMLIGGINLPLTSDAYTGLNDHQLSEASVGINIIENLGASFGSAVIATVVATVVQGLQPTVANSLKGYHAGFLVSTLVLILIFIPGLFLTHKKRAMSA